MSASKLERLLEFQQAMRHVRDGMVKEEEDVIDLCALALFIELNADDAGKPTEAGWNVVVNSLLGGKKGSPNGKRQASPEKQLPSPSADSPTVASLTRTSANHRQTQAMRKAASWQDAKHRLMENAKKTKKVEEMRMQMQGQAAVAQGSLNDGSAAAPAPKGRRMSMRGSVVARRSQAFDSRAVKETAKVGEGHATRLRLMLPRTWLANADAAQLATWEAMIVKAQDEVLHIDKRHDEARCGGLSHLRQMLYAHSMETAELNALAAMKLVADFVRQVPRCFAAELVASLWLPPEDEHSKSKKGSGTEHPVLLTLSKTTTELRLPPSVDSTKHYLSGEVIGKFANDEIINWVPLDGLLVLNAVASGEAGQKIRTKLHLITTEGALAASLLSRYAQEKLVAVHLEEKKEMVRRKQEAEIFAARTATQAKAKKKKNDKEQLMQKAKRTGRESLVEDAMLSSRIDKNTRSQRDEMIDGPESSRRGGGNVTARGGMTNRGGLTNRSGPSGADLFRTAGTAVKIGKRLEQGRQERRGSVGGSAMPRPGALPRPGETFEDAAASELHQEAKDERAPSSDPLSVAATDHLETLSEEPVAPLPAAPALPQAPAGASATSGERPRRGSVLQALERPSILDATGGAVTDRDEAPQSAVASGSGVQPPTGGSNSADEVAKQLSRMRKGPAAQPSVTGPTTPPVPVPVASSDSAEEVAKQLSQMREPGVQPSAAGPAQPDVSSSSPPSQGASPLTRQASEAASLAQPSRLPPRKRSVAAAATSIPEEMPPVTAGAAPVAGELPVPVHQVGVSAESGDNGDAPSVAKPARAPPKRRVSLTNTTRSPGIEASEASTQGATGSPQAAAAASPEGEPISPDTTPTGAHSETLASTEPAIKPTPSRRSSRRLSSAPLVVPETLQMI